LFENSLLFTYFIRGLKEGGLMKTVYLLVGTFLIFLSGVLANPKQPVYRDHPFWQDYAEKIPLSQNLDSPSVLKVRMDRNGIIQVLSDGGLLRVESGRLVRDLMHRPLQDMKIIDFILYDNQFVYLTEKAIFSNAWAGTYYVSHGLNHPYLFALGKKFSAFVVGQERFAYYEEDKQIWKAKALPDRILQIIYDAKGNHFLLLTEKKIFSFSPTQKVLEEKFAGQDMTCLEIDPQNRTILVGTHHGYFRLDAQSFRQQGSMINRLPWPDITRIKKIAHKTWFGTPRGAFAIHDQTHQIDYYASRRWLVDDEVVDLTAGSEYDAVVLTNSGVSIIHFKKMTLEEKSKHFEKLTRLRHVRYGLNSAFTMKRPGDFSTGTLIDQDNDGLWTSMYLAGELFRYAVTKSEDALQNCYEAFEAMERLDYINPIDGFPARAFERHGYKVSDVTRWHTTKDGLWDWKGTTSSDEIVGHFFVYSIFAEVIADRDWRNRAITLMDRIMDHIVRNNWYLIDIDGKPTLWGRWNPEYVNQFPKQVGDRRLNSIEIIGFLQTAYHFTGKEVYREKAYDLMYKHGYLDNIMIPISKIGRVKGIGLSSDWNHSDDELAFLSYWNLYRYAFTKELQEKYRETIRGHYEIEKPEKNPLWCFIYATTGAEDIDLQDAIWSLQEFPLDMIGWSVHNSHRKDIEFLPANFRNQTITKVLPPDERPMSKYNNNAFNLDGGEGGRREYSGDIYLLPYWMGRYIGVIQ